MGTGARVITGLDPGGVRASRPDPDPNLNGPEEALIRLRAYAFSHDRSLRDAAEDIVARRLRF